MRMKATLEVLNGMVDDGVVPLYAIGGAVGAYNYVEATVTEDLDILVSFDATHESRSGLVTLMPILAYLAERGYRDFHKEGVIVEGWPVQFLPVASDLDAEALREAREISLDGEDGSVDTRILKAEHLVATALKVGRPKDRVRIIQFIEEKAVDPDELKSVLERHDLLEAWRAMCDSTGIESPFPLVSHEP